jgi:hypothetical protein
MRRQMLTHWCLCGLILGMVTAESGCRRRDPYTDAYLEVVSAQRRDLEDQIYALEDELERTKRQLEQVEKRAPTRSSRPAGSNPAPRRMDDSELTPPSIDPGTFDPDALELPKIEIPSIEPSPPRNRTMRPEVTPPADTTGLEPMPDPAVTGDGAEDLTPPMLDTAPPSSETLPPPQNPMPDFRRPQRASYEEVDDPRIVQLFINPFRTRGVDLDQHPGDDALYVVIEPRNAAGQFVPQTGALTVVVLDPAAPDDAAHVARWDVSAQEVGRRILETRPEPGIALQLKWPQKRPEHGKLKMFVRYQSLQGEPIETSSDVFVTVSGQLSQRWTPRRE